MKHDIEIPDLPDGWEAVAYRVPLEGEYFLSIDNKISHANDNSHWCPWLIISKKQPRRIVLEETGEIRIPGYKLKIDDGYINMPAGREYKIVEDDK